MAIIAISRQMGSGGYTSAAGVAKALNYHYVDRQMVVSAAKAYDVRAAELARVADQHLAGWEAFRGEDCATAPFWMRRTTSLPKRTTW